MREGAQDHQEGQGREEAGVRQEGEHVPRGARLHREAGERPARRHPRQPTARRRPDRARRGVAQEAELQAVKDKMSKEAEKHKRWHAKSGKDTEGFLKKVKKAGSDWVGEASASPSP
eukprot:COSAG04_NODE_554_length_12674_cov_89.442068_3_plen_117_part_00